MNREADMFFHVGLYKTGTKFLRHNVFPKFNDICILNNKGIDFLLCDKYNNKYDTFLFTSAGFFAIPYDTDFYTKDFEINIKRISSLFPDARIMICFREHRKWFLSLYKQYIQTGGTSKLESGFIDIDSSSKSILKLSEFFYMPMIRIIERYMKYKPFVFLFDSIKSDIDGLMKQFSYMFNSSYISLENNGGRNVGVGARQAEMLRKSNIFLSLFPDGKKLFDNRVTNLLRCNPRSICQYWCRYLFSEPIVFSSRYDSYLEGMYHDDWEAVKKYVGGML